MNVSLLKQIPNLSWNIFYCKASVTKYDHVSALRRYKSTCCSTNKSEIKIENTKYEIKYMFHESVLSMYTLSSFRMMICLTLLNFLVTTWNVFVPVSFFRHYQVNHLKDYQFLISQLGDITKPLQKRMIGVTLAVNPGMLPSIKLTDNSSTFSPWYTLAFNNALFQFPNSSKYRFL